MSSSRPCPHCGFADPGDGANFCQRCGEALRGPPCPKCNAASEAGDHFCTQCGAGLPQTAKAGAGLGSQWVPWSIAGLMVLALIVALMLPDNGPAINLQPPPASSQGLGASAVDLTSMTPREAADRLFSRVMGSVDAGDTQSALNFVPMAIAAYERIPDLNLDDRFHLSLLHAVGNNGQAALDIAEEGLAIRPTHILDLAAAAEAAALLGDTALARTYYQTLVDGYEEELASGLPEYELHSNLLPTLLEEANAFLQSGG